MKTKIPLISFLIIMILVSSSSTVLSDNFEQDGNWWRNINNKTQKKAYAVGFSAGIQLGEMFSVWNFMKNFESNKDKNLYCYEKIVESSKKYYNKYVVGVSSEQIVDGLDKFYEDFRNRKIHIVYGIWIVFNQIAGTSTDKIEEMIENYRRPID